MFFKLRLLIVLAIVINCSAQQPTQSAPQARQGPSAPLLGVRYSAATDVSHVSFNSPLVTYGSSLNEIQLPAAPIQPANLKQANEATPENNEGSQQTQASVRALGQSATPANQPQFLSVQQYPANPQQQLNQQGFSLSQNLPASQPQPQNTLRYASQLPANQAPPQQFPFPQSFQPQQQYASPQQQYVPPQQQYVSPQPQQYALPQQQYEQPQQQEYVPPQPQQYSAPAAYSPISSNAYFATGPYAAQYPQANLNTRQVPTQAVQPQYTTQSVEPQYPQPVAPSPVGPQYAPALAPSAALVSRVAFNGPVGGFSYSF